MNRRKCKTCTRTIAKNHRIIKCISCNSQVHIKCNHTDIKTYNKIITNKLPQICFKCNSQNIPFYNLSDKEFSLFLEKDNSTKACKTCTRTIAKNHRFIHCFVCDSEVHIKCNLTNVQTYDKIIRDKLPQVCFQCETKNIPFHNLSDSEFTVATRTVIPRDKSLHITTDIKTIKLHCGICEKFIARNHRHLHCVSCKNDVHIKCNKTDVKTFNENYKEDNSTICITCQIENIPFQNLTDLQFTAVNKGLITDTEVLQEISVTSTNIKSFFKEMNNQNPFNFFEADEEGNACLINCNYVDLCNFNHKKKKNVFSLFHTNIGSLSKHKEELETVLTMLDFKFDVIGISESKLKKNVKPNFDIEIEGYKCFHVDTEAEKGGSLIYLSDNIIHKERKDIEKQLYKATFLESSFIEIINPHKKMS